MIGNWIALHRQILDSAVFADAELLRLWIWLLARANFQRTHVSMKVGRGTSTVTLLPGQCIVGRKSGAESLGWRESTFRDRLARLEDMGMVCISPDSHWSIVSIVNWRKYQPERDAGTTGKRSHQTTGKQATNDPANRDPSESVKQVNNNGDDNQTTGKRQQTDTDKNDKKEKKEQDVTSQRSQPSGFVFPIKAKGGGNWTLSIEKLDEYFETYGDRQWVEAELRKARQWCRDNPARRKTPSGMTTFLGRWLAKANNDGPVNIEQERVCVPVVSIKDRRRQIEAEAEHARA